MRPAAHAEDPEAGDPGVDVAAEHPLFDPAADHAEEELIELVALGLDGGETVAGEVAALLEEDPDVVAVELDAPHELTEQLPSCSAGSVVEASVWRRAASS